MSTGKLVRIEPEELKFQFELRKQLSCTMTIKNMTDQHVAFKVKVNNVTKYCVRPNAGVILPGGACDVTVTMQAQKVAPPDMQCKDKFLIQSVKVPQGCKTNDINFKMFNKENGKVVEESKLKVIYVPAKPHSLAAAVNPESISSNKFTSMPESVSSNKFTTMIIGDLVHIEPSELKFQFESRKQLSCTMKVKNKTDQYVAFKVKVTNPKKYCVRPNNGVILPDGACDVTVMMQAQKAPPPNMQCKDMFLVQSVKVPEGSTTNDITTEMFQKEDGKVVEESKLKVVYEPTKPHSLASTVSSFFDWFKEKDAEVLEFFEGFKKKDDQGNDLNTPLLRHTS